MEQEWPAGLSERQIAKFVEDDEVHAGQVVGEPALAAGASFGLEPVDEIDHVVEPAAGTATDAASGDGDGQVGLAGTGRTRDIVHRNTLLKLSSIIRIIPALGNASLLSGDSFTGIGRTL